MRRSEPNGFSTTTRLQEPSRFSVSPDSFQLLGDDREHLRRDRQVERVVAQRAALGVEVVDGALELAERLGVVERALHEADALFELTPDVLVERGAGVFLDGVVDELGEVLVLPVATSEPDEREPRGQEPRLARS